MQVSEVYKKPRQHEVELPRLHDLAEVRRGHCNANEDAGLLVQVMGDPHLCETNCAYCGQKVVEYFVEVHTSEPKWQLTPGPWFMPIRWLKRLDPRDPVQYARMRGYTPLRPTEQQLAAANS
jgi:hypothetical protein